MSSHHASLCVQGPDGGPFELCPEGTFKNASGSQSCTPCDEGGSTNQMVGSVTSEDCVAKPGWTNEKTWEDGPFVPCRVGYFKTGHGPHPCKVSLSLYLTLSLCCINVQCHDCIVSACMHSSPFCGLRVFSRLSWQRCPYCTTTAGVGATSVSECVADEDCA